MTFSLLKLALSVCDLRPPWVSSIPADDAPQRWDPAIGLVLCSSRYSGSSLPIPAFYLQPDCTRGPSPPAPSPKCHNPLISGRPLLQCSNPPCLPCGPLGSIRILFSPLKPKLKWANANQGDSCAFWAELNESRRGKRWGMGVWSVKGCVCACFMCIFSHFNRWHNIVAEMKV